MATFKIKYSGDYIGVYRHGKEVLGWEQQEWIDNPQVVFSICHAVELAMANKLDNTLKAMGIIEE